MNSIALNRLQEERKQWRKDHPFGFYAKPRKNPKGGLDLNFWNVGIPGKKGTVWEGATFPVTMSFGPDYPAKPPKCQFPGGFYHPNVYPTGTVCLSILNEAEDWRPATTVKQIVIGIQELLDNPNPKSPAQAPAYEAFINNKSLYLKKVKEQVKQYTE